MDTERKRSHRRTPSMDSRLDLDDSGQFSQGARPFMTYARALLRLLQREAVLASKIVGRELCATVLNSVYAPAMEAFVCQGELLVESMK